MATALRHAIANATAVGLRTVSVSVQTLQAALEIIEDKRPLKWPAPFVQAPAAEVNPVPAVDRGAALCGCTAVQLLNELASRGGTLEQVARAQLLVLRKSEDYNRREKDGPERGGDDESRSRDAYFPFGAASYAQMIHVKAQRLVSLADAGLRGRKVNFEGFYDTALDLLNYASFAAEWSARTTAKGSFK